MQMNKKHNTSLAMLVCSMLLFGTIGVFRKFLPLPSGALACARGFLGGLFLLVFVLIRRKGLHIHFEKKPFWLLVLSGAFLGLNWILLFESYNYTSVAVATLCYYMEPTIVILLSPLFFREKLDIRKIVCVMVSLVGVVLVSDITKVSSFAFRDLKGVLLGLGAASLYSAVVIMNKKNPVEDAYGKTIVQLLSAGVILLPYVFALEPVGSIVWSMPVVLTLLFVGIVHTGICYAMYFGSMNQLKAQTVAVMSYIDPVFAIVLSALVLREVISGTTILGAVFILGAAVCMDLGGRD